MSEYRYDHFHAALMLEDQRFTGGPQLGEHFPEFELPTLDAGTFRSTEHIGRRPLFIYSASVT